MSTGINIKKKLAILDEGASVTTDATSIDFVGSGVNASTVDGDVTITIPGGSGNTTYYLNQTVDQAPYKEFSSIVTSAVEQVIPLTVLAGATSVIAEYQTPSNIPGTTQIPGGLWQFFLHFNAVAAGQNWIIRPTVYKRDLGGTETLIFTPDPEIVTGMSTTTTMYVCDGVFPATTILTTDRIVVRLSMQNTRGVSQTVNFRTEGSQHYSVGLTTLNQVIPTGAVTDVTGTAPIVSSGGLTPAISIPQADASTDGYLSSSDWSVFDAKTPATRQLTINGTTFDLSIDRTWTVGDIVSSGSYADPTWITSLAYSKLTGAPTIPIVTPSALTKNDDTNVTLTLGGSPSTALLAATSLTLGWSGTLADARIASATSWNAKQSAISLTTTGSSGASTFITNTLNVPTYTLSGLGGVPSGRSITINGTTYDLSADRTWNVGTVTSVAALTLGTTGTDLTSSVATGTTTPVITLNVPTANASNRGALSSTDWTTFNGKQNAITLTTTGTSGAATLVGSTLNVPNYASGSSGGIWGIANSSGVYTYYATWALAVAAATSGQCIELFADITENTGGLILKDGVNINGNGHTLTHNFATQGFTDNGVSVQCSINNLTLNKSNSPYYAVYISNGATNINGNAVFKGTQGIVICAGKINGFTIIGGYCLELNASTSVGSNLNVYCTTGTCVILTNGAKLNNSYINTTNGVGVIVTSGDLNNSTVYANGNYGVTLTAGNVNNCSVLSTTSNAINSASGTTINGGSYVSTGWTTGQVLGYTSNAYFRSTVNDGIGLGGNINNCVVISDLYSPVISSSVFQMYNCEIISLTSRASNYGITGITAGSYVVDNIFTISSISTAIHSAGTPTVYLSGNSIKGTTNFKSVGIVNGQTNTADAQGNTILQ